MDYHLALQVAPRTGLGSANSALRTDTVKFLSGGGGPRKDTAEVPLPAARRARLTMMIPVA